MKKLKRKLKVLSNKDKGKIKGGEYYHKHEDGTVHGEDGCPPPEPIRITPIAIMGEVHVYTQ